MKIKLTTLSPIHIGDGNSYIENFNFVRDGDDIYIFDELKVLDYFISKNFLVPQNNLEQFFNNQKKHIIDNTLYKRKIKSFFRKNKEILTTISSQNVPIIPGSSIKGAIETAIFSLLVDGNNRVDSIRNVLNFKIDKGVFYNSQKSRLTPHTLKFKEIFTYLKVSDSIFKKEVNTQIFKTINMKKDKKKQVQRGHKVEKIANYVEAILPKEEFEIYIKDESDKRYNRKIFSNLSRICNAYYIPKINDDIKYYFYKKGSIDTSLLKGLGEKKFILNIGRFSGAEKKTIDDYRLISNSHCNDKNKTSAITFALEKNGTPPFFENELVPFGWVVCEIIE